MKNKIRLSIVGTGYFSQFHFDGWKRLGVDVAGICSLNEIEAQKYSKQFKNCPIFTDFESMILATKPDLVDIIVPPSNHLKFIKIASKNKVNIICQKPFTNSIKEAKEAINNANKNSVRIAIHENFRYQPWYKKINEMLKTYPRDKSASRSKGSGTGWYIGNGYFVTNAHVVQNANKINIFSNKKKYSARVALTDKKLDLALINIKDKSIKLPKVSFAEKFDIGQHIYALGFPLGKLLGDNPKITDGIISSNEGLRGDPTIMTISAPIQPGSSGGPVVDDFGRAVGIVVAKLRDSASSDKDVENINYAVKIDYLIPLLKQINFQLTYGKKEKVDVCSSICSSIVRIEVD